MIIIVNIFFREFGADKRRKNVYEITRRLYVYAMMVNYTAGWLFQAKTFSANYVSQDICFLRSKLVSVADIYAHARHVFR